LEEFAATVNVGTPVICADHGCPASHIEASVTAPLALTRAADLANGLE